MEIELKRWKPEGARAVKSKLAPAVVYLFERQGKPCAIAYAFNQAKAQWHFRFANEEARAKKIDQFFKGVECAVIYKAQRATERQARNSNAGINVGQVFVSSWGYDQTNVDFYEVVELVGKASVKLVKIAGSNLEGAEGRDCGKCIPSDDPDRAKGKEPFLSQISGGRAVSAKIGGRGGAVAWDGRPLYWSAYA